MAKSRYKTPLQASIVIDADTGHVLQASNADATTYPASLTKMMTLYMLFDELSSGRMTLNQRLPVSSHAAAQSPSKLGLKPGESIRVEDAILALVTKSANDIAVVVAEAISGSESKFGTHMTRRARALGMNRTTFRNASGLPDDRQVTTARDMAKLGRALFHNHQRYYHYFSTRSFDWKGDTISSHNRLMLRYRGADGIKTGYIRASGFNLVSSAERDGRRLIGVVLGGRTARIRDNNMENLLDAAFVKAGPARARPETIREAAAAPHTVPTILPPPMKPDAPAAAAPTLAAAAPVAVADESGRQILVLNAPRAKPATASVAGVLAFPEEDDGIRGTGDADEANWGIQLGAFAAESAARNAVEIATRRHGWLAAEGKPAVVRSKSGKKVLFRARIMGITEAQARSACRQIGGSSGCLVLSPGV